MNSKSTLIKNAFIHPITHPPFVGDLIIENGKIKDIGQQLEILSGVEIVECNKLYLFPGFIDVHTHLGLYNEGTGWPGNDANETNELISPHIRAIDGVYPFDPAFLDAIKAGITTVHVMPGSSNIIGGMTSVIKTWGQNIEKMMIREYAGLKIAFGENPKRVHSNGKHYSITRMGIMGMLRELFHEVKSGYHSNYPRYEPILKALNKEIPVRMHAHRSDDILTAIRFAKEFDLDFRIEHCTEGHLIAEELVDIDLKVCVGPTFTRKSKVELRNKSWSTYPELMNRGIEVSITTDHPYTPIQYLNICAAIASREGLSELQALMGITLYPARNLGLEHRIGSIERGKDADLVLWSHHPFHYKAKPIWTMIDGQFVYPKI
jgi:imidazolonepropionase-like amidohydrolase